MLNIHPGLLPSFGGKGMYGARVHAAVLASGARCVRRSQHARTHARIGCVLNARLDALPPMDVPLCRFSGPTVHFVDEEYDTGPILAQRVVPAYPTDTPSQLAARVLEQVRE